MFRRGEGEVKLAQKRSKSLSIGLIDKTYMSARIDFLLKKGG